MWDTPVFNFIGLSMGFQFPFALTIQITFVGITFHLIIGDINCGGGEKDEKDITNPIFQ